MPRAKPASKKVVEQTMPEPYIPSTANPNVKYPSHYPVGQKFTQVANIKGCSESELGSIWQLVWRGGKYDIQFSKLDGGNFEAIARVEDPCSVPSPVLATLTNLQTMENFHKTFQPVKE